MTRILSKLVMFQSFETIGKGVAVNSPVLITKPVGLPVSGVLVTKIVFPTIIPFESTSPLKINVPVSRQQLPIGNCTSPEKVINVRVILSQTAGVVIFGGSQLVLPRNRNVPRLFGLTTNLRLFCP